MALEVDGWTNGFETLSFLQAGHELVGAVQ